MQAFDTVSEAISELRKQGYAEDFNLKEDCLECRNGRFRLFANEFQVDDFFRFEGASDPSDSSIVYAISSESKGLKGVLVNAYGIYSDSLTDEMMEKLKINR